MRACSQGPFAGNPNPVMARNIIRPAQMNMQHKNSIVFWVLEETYMISCQFPFHSFVVLGSLVFFKGLGSNMIQGRGRLKSRGLHMGLILVAFGRLGFFVPTYGPPGSVDGQAT